MAEETKKAAHKKAGQRFKKDPNAPRRFKSAYIFFSSEKHRELKARLGEDVKTTDIAKLVAEEWKALDPTERDRWEEMSRRDKMRYEAEKQAYRGPWRVLASKRTPKDPSAPKRPPSAFLAFSNCRRAQVKRQNPDADNGTISRILSRMWKEAPEEERQRYIDNERKLRDEYKVAIAAWRSNDEKEKEARRQEREDRALQRAEEHAAGLQHRTSEPFATGEMPPQLPYATAQSQLPATQGYRYGGQAAGILPDPNLFYSQHGVSSQFPLTSAANAPSILPFNESLPSFAYGRQSRAQQFQLDVDDLMRQRERRNLMLQQRIHHESSQQQQQQLQRPGVPAWYASSLAQQEMEALQQQQALQLANEQARRSRFNLLPTVAAHTFLNQGPTGMQRGSPRRRGDEQKAEDSDDST